MKITADVRITFVFSAKFVICVHKRDARASVVFFNLVLLKKID